MANDCLVTKLKGVVDNSELLKLGELELGVVNGSKFAFTVLPNTEQFTATLLGGAKFSDEATQKTYTWYNDLATIVGNGKLRITNKYKIVALRFQDGIAGDISVLRWGSYEYINLNNNPQLNGDLSSIPVKQDSASLIEMRISNCPLLSGDITEMLNSINKANSIVDIRGNTNFTINISNISNDKIKTLQFMGSNPNIIGNIEDINIPNVEGPCYLNGINVQGSISNIAYAKMAKVGTLIINDTKCTGTIEGFADNFKAHKSNGSTIAIKCNNLITYQGSPLSSTYMSATITFDGQGGYSVAIS